MSGVSDVQLEVPAAQPPIPVGHCTLKPPGSKPAFKLARLSPKLLQGHKRILFDDPVVTVISGSMGNALFSLEQRLLHAYPPRFRLAHAFPRRDLHDSSNMPWSNDLTAVVKSTSMKRTHIANTQRSISKCTLSTPIQSLPCSSSIVTVTIDDFPENYPNALEDSAGTTTTIVKAWLSDEENMPLYPPTPSPSFEIAQIFPGDNMDISDDTILPLSLNAPSTQSELSPIIIALKHFLKKREVIDASQIAMAWTLALVFVFILLSALVHRIGNALTCIFMIVSSFCFGVWLVLSRCATKRPPTFRIKDPDNLDIQYNDLQSARFDSSEYGQSSVAQVNGLFEISSLSSSQDIFRSELLMNDQVISSTPRKDTLYPKTTSNYTHTPSPSHMSLIVFEMAGTSSENGLRTRRRPFASNLSIV